MESHGLGLNLQRDVDNITRASCGDKNHFEVEIGKDIMTVGLYFHKNGIWKQEGKAKLWWFHIFLAVTCMVS